MQRWWKEFAIVWCFRTPCLIAVVATATRNQSRNSLVLAADDRAAPEQNRQDSPFARRATNARSAIADAQDPSTAIIRSPREPIHRTATAPPKTDPLAKDRISRYVSLLQRKRSSYSCWSSISISSLSLDQWTESFVQTLHEIHYSWIECCLLSWSPVATA